MKTSSILLIKKNPWTISWLLSGLISILIPVIAWNVNKGRYYSAYGYVVAQNQYYEVQNNNYGNNNNNNNRGNYNNWYGYYYNVNVYKECSWINFACHREQYFYAMTEERQRAYQNGEMVQELPAWYVSLGGAENSEQMQKWKEENTGNRGNGNGNGNNASSGGGLKFVYAMTLLLFIALLGYGAFTLSGSHSGGDGGNKSHQQLQHFTNLIVLLVIASIVAFMNLVMTTQGVISSDDRDMEDSYYGWYGQMGVLLALTDFWIMVFSLSYLVAFRVRSFLMEKGILASADEADNGRKVNAAATDYKAPSAIRMA